jgi:hypothetical protein
MSYTFCWPPGVSARRLAGCAAGKLEHTEPAPRGNMVAKLIVSRNDSSPAARFLHPVGTATIAATALTDPFTHPTAQPGQGR